MPHPGRAPGRSQAGQPGDVLAAQCRKHRHPLGGLRRDLVRPVGALCQPKGCRREPKRGLQGGQGTPWTGGFISVVHSAFAASTTHETGGISGRAPGRSQAGPRGRCARGSTPRASPSPRGLRPDTGRPVDGLCLPKRCSHGLQRGPDWACRRSAGARPGEGLTFTSVAPPRAARPTTHETGGISGRAPGRSQAGPPGDVRAAQCREHRHPPGGWAKVLLGPGASIQNALVTRSW